MMIRAGYAAHRRAPPGPQDRVGKQLPGTLGRDVDGSPVTWQEAREIIAERYQVSEKVRQQRSHRTRKIRRDQQAERKQKRRSRQVVKRLTPKGHPS